jgi:hypothetical protein
MLLTLIKSGNGCFFTKHADLKETEERLYAGRGHMSTTGG